MWPSKRARDEVTTSGILQRLKIDSCSANPVSAPWTRRVELVFASALNVFTVLKITLYSPRHLVLEPVG